MLSIRACRSLVGVVVVLAVTACSHEAYVGAQRPKTIVAGSAPYAPPPGNPSCTGTGASLGGFAVYGRARARLGQSVEVKGGDVGVKEARAPQRVIAFDVLFREGPDFDLLLEPHARVDVAKRVFAGSVLLKTGARVGQVFINRLDNRGGTHGAVSPFPTMPDLVAVPEVAGGTRAITVASGRTVTLDPASDLAASWSNTAACCGCAAVSMSCARSSSPLRRR